MRENHMLGASMKNWNNQKQQIPTLEILPEGTKLTGVTAVIPVFFIAFGIMEMLQNIWGDAAPGHLVLLIGLLLLCGRGIKTEKEKKRWNPDHFLCGGVAACRNPAEHPRPAGLLADYGGTVECSA